MYVIAALGTYLATAVVYHDYITQQHYIPVVTYLLANRNTMM